MGLEKIACCYHRFTAYFIQYAMLIIDIIGFIFHIVGFSIIKWKYIPDTIIFLYAICFIIYIFNIFCICIIIYFRYKKTINGKNNKSCKIISIINIIVIIFAIIFSFICLIICWIKYDKNKKTYINNKKAINGWDKFFMFLCLGINSRCTIFLFFLWISILIRLKKKISGSYIENEVQKLENTSTISDNREVKVSYGLREYNLK